MNKILLIGSTYHKCNQYYKDNYCEPGKSVQPDSDINEYYVATSVESLPVTILTDIIVVDKTSETELVFNTAKNLLVPSDLLTKIKEYQKQYQ